MEGKQAAPLAVLAPSQVLEPKQPYWAVTVQAPEPEQHAPMVHGLGEHDEPEPL